ncbi:MAG: hypothetical protein J4A00_06625 [Gammaproteobacteria bacterium]|nr:hypothetical protein [Gammaproteobacteria bacterium]
MLATIKSPTVLWSLIALLVIAAYWPGLSGPFVFDDQINIVENPGVAIDDLSLDSLRAAALSNHSGPLGRTLPALSFGLNHYLAGGFDKPLVFKATNLLIHLLNSALLLALLLRLTPRLLASAEPSRESAALALLGCLIWALHPLQLTSVLYVVQRMTSLSALFVLSGLLLFTIGRARLESRSPHAWPLILGGLITGGLLGLSAKENAALTPLFFLVIEFTLFRWPEEARARRALTAFYGLTLALPALLVLGYLLVHPGYLINGYGNRPFSLAERVLTEPRILWFYISELYLPVPSRMGLFHDDLAISHTLTAPWTTLPAILGGLVALLAAARLRRTLPVVSFGVLWFLAGHLLESTLIPLEIAHEHRNYLASLGPLLLLAWSLLQLLKKLSSRAVRGLLLFALTITLGFSTYVRATAWHSEVGLIESLARNHPRSATSQYLFAEALQKRLNDPVAAYSYYQAAAELAPTEAGFWIALLQTPVSHQLRLASPELSTAVATTENHVAELLRDGPITAWTTRALEVAARCMQEQREYCLSLQPAMNHWRDALFSNPGAGQSLKHNLLIRQFNVDLNDNDLDRALHYAKWGQKLFPEELKFNLMEANVLLLQGQLESAEKLLYTLKERAENRGGVTLSNYHALQTGLTKRRAMMARQVDQQPSSSPAQRPD